MPPESLAIARLTPRRVHPAQQGHLWVYRSEIAALEGAPADGDAVEVLDSRGRPLGRGFYNSRSQIAVRLLTRRPDALDDAFWAQRLDTAIAYRAARFPDRPACRLVAGEADRLPGLIVDRYGAALALQTTTCGMDRRLELWARLLEDRLRPDAIYEINDSPARRLEGLPPRRQRLRGAGDGSVTVRLGRGDFAGHLLDGQKTGFYLDQQLNYELVADWVRPGMCVLDAFCYLAGFGIHALLAGAAAAVAVDSNARSLAAARDSAQRSGVADRLTLQAANAFDVLRAAAARGDRYDLVILDPPSFTRTRQAVPEAERGYREIHVRALKLLAPGGLLATFCCSHHVARPAFEAIILEAAADTGVCLRREALLGASPDHPVLPAVPETEYLKGFLYTVVETRRA